MKRKDEEKKSTEERKPYRTPRLTEYGSVRQFTRTLSSGNMTDGGTGLKSKKNCIAALSAIEEHRFLIADTRTQSLFRQAIFQTVRPGDTVLDLGTGTGIHALFACQAGARKVYAVEADTVIELAREVARENGFADRIDHIYGFSSEIELPEKVDVIVTNLGFVNTLIHLPEASRRFLKPGGRLVPSGAQLHFAPVSLSDYYRQKVESWEKRSFGLSFAAFRPYAANHPDITHLDRRSFLAPPESLDPIDYRSEEREVFHWSASYRIERDDMLHGLAGWYSFKLSPSTILSAEPPLELSPHLWFHPFLPLEKPIMVKRGTRVEADLTVSLSASEYDPIWKWVLEIDGERLEQTSFHTVPLSKQLLGKLKN
jgi:protein arginine N-methyltransferase 1